MGWLRSGLMGWGLMAHETASVEQVDHSNNTSGSIKKAVQERTVGVAHGTHGHPLRGKLSALGIDVDRQQPLQHEGKVICWRLPAASLMPTLEGGFGRFQVQSARIPYCKRLKSRLPGMVDQRG